MVIGKVSKWRKTSARPGDFWTGARSPPSMLSDEIWKGDNGEKIWRSDDGEKM
jgi:hypothetical protein